MVRERLIIDSLGTAQVLEIHRTPVIAERVGARKGGSGIVGYGLEDHENECDHAAETTSPNHNANRAHNWERRCSGGMRNYIVKIRAESVSCQSWKLRHRPGRWWRHWSLTGGRYAPRARAALRRSADLP